MDYCDQEANKIRSSIVLTEGYWYVICLCYGAQFSSVAVSLSEWIVTNIRVNCREPVGFSKKILWLIMCKRVENVASPWYFRPCIKQGCYNHKFPYGYFTIFACKCSVERMDRLSLVIDMTAMFITDWGLGSCL